MGVLSPLTKVDLDHLIHSSTESSGANHHIVVINNYRIQTKINRNRLLAYLIQKSFMTLLDEKSALI